MAVFKIPVDQCVLDKETQFYVCMICDHLAYNFLIHDGGHGEQYCQRPFCRTCIDTYAMDCRNLEILPNADKRIGCPVGNCKNMFKHPMFRAPSVAEDYYYNKIRVKCLKCLMYFVPVMYMNHLVDCLSGRSVAVVSNDATTVPAELVQSKVAFVENMQRQANRHFVSVAYKAEDQKCKCDFSV